MGFLSRKRTKGLKRAFRALAVKLSKKPNKKKRKKTLGVSKGKVPATGIRKGEESETVYPRRTGGHWGKLKGTAMRKLTGNLCEEKRKSQGTKGGKAGGKGLVHGPRNRSQ